MPKTYALPDYTIKSVQDVMLTPPLLEVLLAALRDNRRPRSGKIRMWADAMLRGEWAQTNDALSFIHRPGNPKFGCRNGQHRLMAYQLALETNPDLVVPVSVRFNAEPESARVMDLGVPRSLADTLDFMTGHDGANRHIATVARLCWHIEHGSYLARLPSPTRIQELDYIDEHRDDLTLAVAYARPMQAKLRGPLGGFGAACFLILKAPHAEGLDVFADRVSKGENLTAQDPEYRMREQLIDAAMRAGESVPDHRRGWYYTGVIVKAWNDRVRNRRAPQRGYAVTRRTGIPEAL